MPLTDVTFAKSSAALAGPLAWFYALPSEVRKQLSGQVVTHPARTAPVGSVAVPTTGDLKAFFAAQPAGTTYWFTPGTTYRLPLLGYAVGDIGIVAKTGDQYLSDPSNKAVLKGSIDISTGWTLVGGAYRRAYTTAQVAPSGTAASTACNILGAGFYPCTSPDDVYIDGAQQLRVNSSTVAAGEYFIDYTADFIYLGSNPATHTVEIAQVRFGIIGGTSVSPATSATSVTVEGLELTEFAGTSQYGAITTTDDGTGWTIRYCYVHQNHACGLYVTNGCLVEWCRIEQNGQMGVKATSATLGAVPTPTGHTIRYCRIVGNKLFDTRGYKNGWEGGGSKYAKIAGSLVEANYSSGNYGAALWFDVAVYNSVMRYNVAFEELLGASIFDEASYDNEICYNLAVRGGSLDTRSATSMWGAGVFVATSNRSNVHHNMVVKCKSGIGFLQQSRESGGASPTAYKRTAAHALVVNTDATGERNQIEGSFCDDNWVVLDTGQYMGVNHDWFVAGDTLYSGGVLFRRNQVWVTPAQAATRFGVVAGDGLSATVTSRTVAAAQTAFPTIWVANVANDIAGWHDSWLPVGLT